MLVYSVNINTMLLPIGDAVFNACEAWFLPERSLADLKQSLTCSSCLGLSVKTRLRRENRFFNSKLELFKLYMVKIVNI